MKSPSRTRVPVIRARRLHPLPEDVTQLMGPSQLRCRTKMIELDLVAAARDTMMTIALSVTAKALQMTMMTPDSTPMARELGKRNGRRYDAEEQSFMTKL